MQNSGVLEISVIDGSSRGPDLSISALYVNYFPYMAHGIFEWDFLWLPLTILKARFVECTSSCVILFLFSDDGLDKALHDIQSLEYCFIT